MLCALKQLIYFALVAAFAHSAHAEELSESKKYVWTQAQFGASIFDTKADAPVQRLSGGLQIGHRLGRFGYFANAELNRSLEYQTVRPDIHLVQLGPGVDFVSHERNIRSSISAGATILTHAAGSDTAGKVGWFIDVRPVSIRFPQKSGVIEFTPLNIDISIPSSDSLLSMHGNFMIIAYEWSSR